MTPDARPRADRLQLALGLIALVGAAIALMGPALSLAFAALPRDDFYEWWGRLTFPLVIAAGAGALSVVALGARAIMARVRRNGAGFTESAWAAGTLAVAAVAWFLMARWIFSWPLT